MWEPRRPITGIALTFYLLLMSSVITALYQCRPSYVRCRRSATEYMLCSLHMISPQAAITKLTHIISGKREVCEIGLRHPYPPSASRDVVLKEMYKFMTKF
jgi:hypothetical protein